MAEMFKGSLVLQQACTAVEFVPASTYF